MFDPNVLISVAATFLLAGVVKGVIGLGLPTVSLGLLTAALDLSAAMALLLAPSFVTNLWQGAVGGHARAILSRTWPFMVAATVSIPVGALALSTLNLSWLSALLGALLIAYGGLSLAGLQFSVSPKREATVGPFLGLANGILTGMTGSFVVPGVLYLQALGLPRDALVQAMGILFTLSTVMLGLALGQNNLLSAELGWLSLAAVVPALVGMMVGRELRKLLPEKLFRRVFFSALVVLGAYIVAAAFYRLV